RVAERALDQRHGINGAEPGREDGRAVPGQRDGVVIAPEVGEAAGLQRHDDVEVAAGAKPVLDEAGVAGHSLAEVDRAEPAPRVFVLAPVVRKAAALLEDDLEVALARAEVRLQDRRAACETAGEELGPVPLEAGRIVVAPVMAYAAERTGDDQLEI